MIVRAEQPRDESAIAGVVEAAFSGTIESRLIDLIRASPGFMPGLSLVATVDGEIVGHALFSRVTIEGDQTWEVLSLAPLAVHPDHQRRGIGTGLTTAGLAKIDAMGEPLVVVEGHPAYYPRLGFERASLHGIDKPAPQVPDNAFMVRRLSSYDPAIRGRLVYPAPFLEVGAIGP